MNLSTRTRRNKRGMHFLNLIRTVGAPKIKAPVWVLLFFVNIQKSVDFSVILIYNY